ncbi:MAG: hypothetical protein E7044_13415 [Lentisphaerae bacterium]|nr:hypothetical protein [Lentisphaerota bacterium]
MLCDNCQKNEATIHIKRVVEGKVRAIHLCAECAKEQEEQGAVGALGFNLAEVLFNIAGLRDIVPPEPETEEETVEDSGSDTTFCCPDCGWTMEKLRQSNGKLGCSECYRSFAVVIHDAFSRMQRGKIHMGKKPGDARPFQTRAALQLEIARCKKELSELVRREEYERAAVCRDKLNELTFQLLDIESQEDDNEQ